MPFCSCFSSCLSLGNNNRTLATHTTTLCEGDELRLFCKNNYVVAWNDATARIVRGSGNICWDNNFTYPEVFLGEAKSVHINMDKLLDGHEYFYFEGVIIKHTINYYIFNSLGITRAYFKYINQLDFLD